MRCLEKKRTMGVITVEECDATKADSNNKAGSKKEQQLLFSAYNNMV
jgi:hypothetical protein